MQGPVINLYGWGGLIFHASLNTISFMFLMLVGFFKQMDASYEEAAITLGASKLKLMLTITFPMLAPAILSMSLLVFIHGLESFENPLLFGNPGGVYVFANEIYRMLSYRHPPEYGAATALSVILIVVTFALLVVQWRKLGGRRFTVVTGKGYRPTSCVCPIPLRWSIFALFVVYFLLAVVIPIGQIVFNSFFEIFGLYGWQYVTLKNWTNVLNNGRAHERPEEYDHLRHYRRLRRRRHRRSRRLHPGAHAALARLCARADGLGALDAAGGGDGPGVALGLGAAATAVQPLRHRARHHHRFHRQRPAARARRRCSRRCTRSARSSRNPPACMAAPGCAPSGISLRRCCGVARFAAFVIVFAIASRDLTIPLLLYRDDTETLTVTLLHYYETANMGTLAATSLIQLALVMVLLALDRFTREKED